VFVDEESCIGCGQCANIAIATFTMLDNGRARSFHQANTPDVSQAVAACPVNCIKYVSFDELKQLELSRDKGDGRLDHKHLGKEMTPLHVSRRSSDASHKSSWYHYLKNKCSSEKMCPQRGCFDCPMFNNPGDNPYFQKKHRDAERMRAKDILDSGQGKLWRKYVDL
jgi:ferredoxin